MRHCLTRSDLMLSFNFSLTLLPHTYQSMSIYGEWKMERRTERGRGVINNTYQLQRLGLNEQTVGGSKSESFSRRLMRSVMCKQEVAWWSQPIRKHRCPRADLFRVSLRIGLLPGSSAGELTAIRHQAGGSCLFTEIAFRVGHFWRCCGVVGDVK